MSHPITQLNKLQRIDMIESGLNPLNPEHVKKYIQSDGNVRANIKENEERMKALMGDKLNASLGHGDERDVDPNPGSEYTPMDRPAGKRQLSQNPADYKSMIAESMDEYASSVPAASAKLMNIRETPRQQGPAKINLNEVAQRGQKLATDYYNAFIKSLQSPSTASNLAVYKSLKALLEQEKALQESQALPVFQKNVKAITEQMYKQLKG